MYNYNHAQYLQNINKNTPYFQYPNNQMNYYNQITNKNKDEKKQYPQNKKNDIYNIYNSNINSINININTINLPNKNNKKISLQDEILSPNIEDNRPRPPTSNYYDDYNFYSNKSSLKYKTNNKFNDINNTKNLLYDSYTLYKAPRRIYNIEDHKNINQNKKMLILDLDETLVHSCLKPIQIQDHKIQPDIYLKVKFHSNYHNVYVLKRPFVDEFLEEMNKYYNLIIFTASVQEYADPLLDQLDKKKVIKLRYYRNSCTMDKNGKFVKDLATLHKDLSNVILLDNNPISYSYNKANGLPIITWHFDKKDKELAKLIPVLQFLSNVKDVRNYIPKFIDCDLVNYNKFNLLLEEIDKENEQNQYLKKRPKSTKHFNISKNDKPNHTNNKKGINYNENIKYDKDKNNNKKNYTNLNQENKRYEEKYQNNNNMNNINHINMNKIDENNHFYINHIEQKYHTINNTDSNEEKDIINNNNELYKSQVYEKKDLNKGLIKSNSNIKNLKKHEHHHKKKEKHKKNKLTNSFKRNNNKINNKGNRTNSASEIDNSKGNTERLAKENKINNLLNSNNINSNEYYKNNKIEKNNNFALKKDNFFLIKL